MHPLTVSSGRRWVIGLSVGFLCACTSASLPDSHAAGARAQEAHLSADAPGFSSLERAFESANPGYGIDWLARIERVSSGEQPRILFVQAGEGAALVGDTSSPYAVGDLILLRPHQDARLAPAAGILAFTVPDMLPDELPAIIRPDWDPGITDTPGGCATETGAYRRILLTWQGKNGPYLYHALNAHRVRVMDSFTHYHPVQGGFDEFYLVQMAQPGARLIVGEDLPALLDHGTVTAGSAASLLREIPLTTGDLIYLPRGVVHRGLGGVLAQVISAPGFVPGSEIGVDDQLRSINMRLGLTGSAGLPVHDAPAAIRLPEVALETLTDRIRFTIDGQLFTEYRTEGRFPAFFPVRNPAGHDMTRAWPFEKRAGESQDHPHHRSLWFAHGDMNGVDFWHDKDTVVNQRRLLAQGSDAGRAWFEAANTWVDGSGRLICTDERRVTAFTTNGAWGLDTDITVTATGSGLTFGDTKEGTFAIRLAPGLVADEGATLVDAAGHEGRDAWGKRSPWMLSAGMVGGSPAAVAIFDHADNPRHPTTWHARTYGLVAANPFGLSAFEKRVNGAGILTLAPGESVRFRHRFLFFEEHPTAKTLRTLSREFHTGS